MAENETERPGGAKDLAHGHTARERQRWPRPGDLASGSRTLECSPVTADPVWERQLINGPNSSHLGSTLPRDVKAPPTEEVGHIPPPL